MSSSVTILLIPVIAGAAGLFATKPSETDIHNRINELIVVNINNTKTSDLFSGVVKYTCSSNQNECVKIIKSTMNIIIVDKFLWQVVAIVNNSNTLLCIAALNKLSCPKFLNDNKKQQSSSKVAQRRNLYFSNKCHKPIKMALAYKDSTSKWETNGWWEFKGNTSNYLASNNKNISVSDSNLYYYAEIPNTDMSWSGDDYKTTFDNRSIGMMKTSMNINSKGDYVHELTCSNVK